MNAVSLSVLLGVISMFGFGLSSVFVKPLIEKYGALKSVAIREMYIVGLCLLLALPFLFAPHDWLMFLLGIVAGMLGYLPLAAFFKAIEKSPIGLVAPITGAAPFVSLLLSLVLLNTTITALQWVAIIMILIANVLISLSVRDSHNKNWLSGLPYAFVAMAGWGVYFFFLIPISRSLGPWLTPLATEGGVLIASLLALVFTKQFPKTSALGDRRALLPALCIFVGTATYALASTTALPGIFSPLAQSSGIVTVVVGALLLKERLGWKQRAITAVMLVGVILLSLS